MTRPANPKPSRTRKPKPQTQAELLAAIRLELATLNQTLRLLLKLECVKDGRSVSLLEQWPEPTPEEVAQDLKDLEEGEPEIDTTPLNRLAAAIEEEQRRMMQGAPMSEEEFDGMLED